MKSNHTEKPRQQSKTPPPKAAGYREQYGVIVLCEGEKDQIRAYNDLRARGYKCRVVVT